MKLFKLSLFLLIMLFSIPTAQAEVLGDRFTPWNIKPEKYAKEFNELHKTKILLNKTRAGLKKLKQKLELLEWSLFIKKYDLQLLKRTVKYAPKPSNWSFLFSAYKKTRDVSVQVESGLRFYYTRQDIWDFARYEPFLKVKKGLFKNRLYLYGILVLESTRVKYKLSDYEAGFSKISVRASFKSDLNPNFGVGAQVFLLSWKKLKFYGYGQIQTTNINDATLDTASFTLNGTEFDMYEMASEHLNATYYLRRHDCGFITSYKFFNRITASMLIGYIWFDATIQLTMDEDLASTIRLITGNNPRDVIPNRLSINFLNPFGMLKIKSKIYKGLHIGVEGTAMPGNRPIYFGSISVIFED
ncbi:hypothetical protein ACFL29_01005 [Patescibacteria group bacterium]